ncbi:MAG: hypothetical protein KIS68_16630 [Bauldia sp.]|nr:hypothetical protein [Bauldia sp.]
MSRGVTIALLILVALLIIVVIFVNVVRCETYSGPFGFLRFTACTEQPILAP